MSSAYSEIRTFNIRKQYLFLVAYLLWGGPGSRDHSSDHCLATQHYSAFRTQQCELYIDVDCRDLRDLYESQWQQHLEHQLRQQHHQLRQQLHQQYQHRVKQHQHRHQQQHQLGEEQQVQSSEPRNVSISATLAGTFLARVNPATSTARQIRCSTVLSGRIYSLKRRLSECSRRFHNHGEGPY